MYQSLVVARLSSTSTVSRVCYCIIVCTAETASSPRRSVGAITR